MYSSDKGLDTQIYKLKLYKLQSVTAMGGGASSRVRQPEAARFHSVTPGAEDPTTPAGVDGATPSVTGPTTPADIDSVTQEDDDDDRGGGEGGDGGGLGVATGGEAAANSAADGAAAGGAS